LFKWKENTGLVVLIQIYAFPRQLIGGTCSINCRRVSACWEPWLNPQQLLSYM